MAVSDTQKVDYLWKKVGYGVTKTDTTAFKRAYNESISSPLLIRGDKVWQRSGEIPAVIPAENSDILTIYQDGSGSFSATIECEEDITATNNRTWKTNLTDWVPPEFGATYQVKVYVDSPSSTTSQTTGTQLFSTGAGNNDEWFFDYQSGVLHFIGDNLPADISDGVSDKVIYVSGARYTGSFGVGAAPGQTASVGNLSISDTTISTVDPNSDLVLDANGPGVISLAGNPLTNVGEPTQDSDAATKGYVDDYFAAFNDDRIALDDTSIVITDDGVDPGVIDVVVDGTNHSRFDAAGYTIGDTTISSGTITNTGVLDIDSSAGINIPTGDTAQRPSTPTAGDFRFNTETASAEIYDGNTWVKLSNNIESQIIVPDGVNDTFTLDQDATTDSVMVTLNGVVQSPAAYTVSGTSISFNETPLATDIIDVRFLATTVATRLASPTPPASANSTGNPGQVAYDSGYVYICVAKNTWLRAPLSTW